MHTYTVCTYDMKIDEFLTNVLSSEEKCFTCLRRYGLYSKNSLPCTGKGGLVCVSNMVLKTRLVKGQKLPFFCCGVAKCRASQSQRSTNNFFSFHDIHGNGTCNMSICDVMWLVYTFCFLDGPNTVSTMRFSGNARQTVLYCHSLCRESCTLAKENNPGWRTQSRLTKLTLEVRPNTKRDAVFNMTDKVRRQIQINLLPKC